MLPLAPVLIDTAQVPALLREHGIEAQAGSSFGSAPTPPGLRVITGRKPSSAGSTAQS